MTKRATLISSIIATTFALITPAALAIEPEVQALVNEGDAFMDADDAYSANISYVNAKGKAADLRDWDGMLVLADRFLKISSEWHAKDCYLIASQIGHEIADRAGVLRDQDVCDRAIDVLDNISLFWEVDLMDLPKAADTQSQMQGMAGICFANANSYRNNGCF